MIIANTHPVGADYALLRLHLLRILEGGKPGVYFDTANTPHPTVGIGLNLDDSAVRSKVFAALGITSQVHINALIDILNSPAIRALPGGDDPGERNHVMQLALNNYLLHSPGAATAATFTLTDAQMNALFLDEAHARELRIAAAGVAAGSYEMLAVLSADYNAVFGDGLKRAIDAGDRAEAWFELRYGWKNTGTSSNAAFAKRRFAESTLFGLYDTDGVSTEEALDIYRMLALHRPRIEEYERAYSASLATAQADLNAAFLAAGMQSATPTVANLVTELESARARMVADLNAQNNLSLSASNYLATNIFMDPGRTTSERDRDLDNPYDLNSIRFDAGRNEIVSNDILIGEGGFDTLTSGGGDDVLIGGAGMDALYGGAGNDTYIYRTGDGTDHILDTGNDGSIVYDGITLGGAEIAAWSDPANSQVPAWLAVIGGRTFYFRLHNAQRTATGSFTGELWIEADGAAADDRIIVEQFEVGLVNGVAHGDLGLNLSLDTLLAWVTSGVIANPFSEPQIQSLSEGITMNEGGARTLSVALNIPAAAGQVCRISVGNANGLVVVTGAEVLEFVNGYVDIVLAAGQTMVTFSLVSQGDFDTDTQSDFTATLLDAQLNPISAGVELSVDLVANDEDLGNPVTTNTIDPYDPNSVEGPRGTRFADHYGTAQNDLIFSRSGIWGGGSVTIYDEQGGDDDMRGADGADQLFGGSGNDVISGGGYIDFLYGDLPWNVAVSGDDVLIGNIGSDLLVGGGGNDQLWAAERGNQATAVADAEAQASSAERGDFLIGEDGDDFMVGSIGYDVLAGGNGQDVLVGGGGDDLLLGDLSYEFQYGIPIYLTDLGEFDWEWLIDRQQAPQPDGSVRYTFTLNNPTPDTTLIEIPADAVAGGADRIYGGAGNDGIFAGYGDDFADGGAGDDALSGGEGNDTLLGGAGVDLLIGGDITDTTGRDFIDGGADSDTIFGGAGSDVLYGGSGNDYIFADHGDETLAGDDYVNGEDGEDMLAGGTGSDTMYGGADNDSMYGDFSDTTAELQGDDFMDGGAGDDLLIGEGGADTLIGGDGNDRLYGESSATPEAVHGNDYLEGGLGDDLLVGEGGADTLLGGAGNDRLYGESNATPDSAHQADYLDGGDGDDLLIGSGGGDTLIGGAGNDQLYGDASDTPLAIQGDDYLSGGAGEDILQGLAGNDTLLGGDDADSLSGGEGDDYLDGGQGNDTLRGGAGNDVLYGGGGADLLLGGAGDDTYIFNADDLTITGGVVDGVSDNEGVNRLVFLSGFDLDEISLTSGSNAGSITLSAGTLGLVVQNALYGGISGFSFADGTFLSASQLIGGYFNGYADQTSYADNATLIGGTRNDFISAFGDHATISGGLGDDDFIGGAGSTTYRFESGDGTDTVTDRSTFAESNGASVNTLAFGAGIGPGNLTLSFAPGSSQLVIDLGAGDAIVLNDFTSTDVLNGPRTIDRFTFADGTTLDWAQLVAARGITIANDGSLAVMTGTNVNDVLLGSSSAESLNGADGNDVLNGGEGNDTLTGGAGNDTYRFGAAWGSDLVDITGALAGDTDVLEFTAVDPAGLRFYRYNDDLIVSQAGTTNRVTVRDQFLGQGIDQVRFADGTTIDAATITLSSPLEQITENADTVFGTQNDDVILTLGPGDVVYGGRGNDTLQGGTTIYGEEGNDILTGVGTAAIYGGVGDDVINGDALQSYGGDGNDTLSGVNLHGDVGNDTLLGADAGATLDGGAGDDHLQGGVGNDQLDGGDGNDILLGGDGTDVLTGGTGDDVLTGGAGNDQLNGGGGANRYVFAVGGGQDVIVDAYTSTPTIDASGTALADLLFRRVGANLVITFLSSPSDQLILNGFFNGETPVSNISLRYGNDQQTLLDAAQIRVLTLAGTNGVDVLNGYSGNDVINTLGGDDIVQAGDGDDYVNGGQGNDQLTGGAGNDRLIGGDGDDQLLAGDGFDILEGGAGADRMEGGAGDDRYTIAANWGSDIIVDSAGFEQVSFGTIAPTDLLLRRDGTDLVVTNRATGDQLRVTGQFSTVAGQAGATALEQFIFSNGPTGMSWDYAAIKQRALEGTADADVIYGHADADVIDAGAGNDSVLAGDGNDQVTGGDGNDTLEGGAGDDVLSGGAGDDVLRGQAGNNQLSGGAGTDELYGADGDDSLSGGADDDMLDAGTGEDTLYGGDGNDELTAIDGGDSLFGEAGNDTLRGQGLLDGGGGDDILEGSGELLGGDGSDQLRGQGFDILRGGAGNDVLETYSNAFNQGSNTLQGGAGNDTLYGSFGEDTYIFNLGDGRDLLIERRANEAYGNVTPTADTLSFGPGIVASDLSYHRRGNDLVIEHANGADAITVQNWFVEPTDHFKLEQFLFADGSSLSQAQVENLVVRHGTATGDSFVGYRSLNDTMLLGDGDDFAWGRAGNDTLHGEGGDDYLEGEAGNDALYGGIGDDQLDGGAQNDLMVGGAGDDAYVYSPGDGSDTIDNTGGGNDGVFFLGGITESRLSFSRDGNDLLILVDGDAAQSVRVLGHFLGGDRAISYVQPDGGYSISAERIGHIVAAQGVPGNFETLIEGTSGADELVGYAGRDLLRGQGGDDDLFGMGGNDQLEGGDGVDYLSGGNGSQTGSGNDVLIGGNGDDILDGEDGNDTLTGGAGNDAYYYRVANGVDVIDNTGGGIDRAFFIDIARSRLSFLRDGNDLVILVDGDAGQQLRVSNHFLGGDYSIDFVHSAGNDTLTTAQINQLVSGSQWDQIIDGTAAGETLVGGAGKDLIRGLGGDDDLFGLGGDDSLQGGDGADYLSGGNGSGSGSGADRLEGGAGDDTLSGEDGANVLIGGVGSDYYVHGTGQDTIDNTGGGSDGVFFDAAIAQSNLTFTRDGDDLVISVNGSSSNTVRVTNHFLGGDYALDFVQPGSGSLLDTAAINALAGGGSNPGGGGDQGNDADYPNVVTGTAAGEQLLGTSGRDLIRGLGGGDTMFGFGGDDKFDGGDGNDYISGGNGSYSGSGNDILLGGAGDDSLVGEDGNDTLFGGAGDDDYHYRAGAGSDIIDNVGGGLDVLFFIDIAPSRLAFHQDGNDLIIRVDANPNQQVRVLGHFLGGEHAISYVQPANGYNAIAASQIPGLLTPLPSGLAAMATEGSAVSTRAELDSLIAAMAGFAPSESSLGEWTPPRTIHYELAATA